MGRIQYISVAFEKLLAGLSTAGVVAVRVTTRTVNADVFFDFTGRALIPNMLPFNWQNPRSVVVMDNLSVHHTEETQMGILVLFLPPYIVPT